MRLYRVDYTRFTDGVRVGMESFMVVKETKCGYWIEAWGGAKWVSRSGRKRYAHPTKEEAIESFRARKNRHILILKLKIEEIQRALYVDPNDYSEYTVDSSFWFPDRGDRREFKHAVLNFVDTSTLHDVFIPF